MSASDALAHWLKTVQDTDLGARQVIDPARAQQPVGAIIKSAGGGSVFDAEPAQFFKLLTDLAPDDLKPAEKSRD